MKSNTALVELSRGFHIRSADPKQFVSIAALESDNPWEVLGALLVRAQRGNFSDLHRIEQLLRSTNESLFWHAAIELFSLATSWKEIVRLGANLKDRRDDPETQYFLAILFGNACDLRAVEALLSLHANSDEDDVRYEVERNLSHLLEPANGPLWYGADETEVAHDVPDPKGGLYVVEVDKAGYAAAVRKTRDRLSLELKTNAIFGAELFAVAKLADRLDKRLMESEVQSDRIFHERMILEASTGIDCSGFFDSAGNLVQLSAAAIMAELLDSDLSRFEPGRRYFFGHPIPD